MPSVSKAEQELMAPTIPTKSQAQQCLTADYVAGFFDGEGYVTIRRANKYKGGIPSYTPVIGFTNTDLHVLAVIQEFIGAGHIYPKVCKNPNASPAWELVITKKADVKAVVEMLRPLVLIKGDRLDVVLALLNLGKMKKTVVGRRRVHPIKGGTIPMCVANLEEVELREALKDQLTILNHRGVNA